MEYKKQRSICQKVENKTEIVMTESDNGDISFFEPIDKEKVKKQIYDIRRLKVMLDRDIAVYFGVTTGNLNKAMKRNIKRFPENFCFQLTNEECTRFQIGILYGGRGSNLKIWKLSITDCLKKSREFRIIW